jgi:hypothetical protein
VNVTPLVLAVRPYPKPEGVNERKQPQKVHKLPDKMLVFDTETRTDASQRLTFGSYRVLVDGKCLEENLFCGDDLPGNDRRVLDEYVTTHKADAMNRRDRRLRLLTRDEFLKKLFFYTYKGRFLLVAFNFPFDVSRLAHDFSEARGRFAGGFSLDLWSYGEESGEECSDHYRPRVAIKKIDSKRALKGFTRRKKPDKEDLIPEGSLDGKPKKEYVWRGHFLDLRTLAFALTDQSYSLETACKEFGVEHEKQSTATHGIVTDDYIDYNRRDVLATSELAIKLFEEYEKHPITLQATKAYSPASVGKAYLRVMGIRPILERQPDFPEQYLGYAQSAFFGGRTSAHIRKVGVPVVYTDFLSMYPTVNSLMDLWRYVTAQEIKVVEHCKEIVESFLKELTVADLFDPATWKSLPGFVKVVPNGDVLPSRGKYSHESGDWQVAVNHLYSKSGDACDGLWFTLPDVVASKVLTGRVPKIIDAFRIEPRGNLEGLEPTKLRGAVDVDPVRQDFFKVVIEQRNRLSSQADMPQVEQDRLDRALKVLANAASYGIYAEMNRMESEREINVECHGIDAEPFNCRAAHPDVPGEYCFPPLASLITGAARLILSLLERSVTELGGTYAMEDTDSMAIVATEQGGIVSLRAGPQQQISGLHSSVRALSWKEVDSICERFAALNPYDRSAVPSSVLKIEKDNLDPLTGKQRQLYCLAISAKRYALFVKDANSVPVLLRRQVNNKKDRWSQHGLGHLLNPIDPQSEDRNWIGQSWLRIIRKSFDLDTEDLCFEQSPAVGQTTISSPAVIKPLTSFNEGKRYAHQIKPFNFLLTCHVRPLGHPLGVDPARFHLIAPYEKDPRRWLQMNWIDQYTETPYRINTAGHHGSRTSARVKTYGEVLREYEFHPESKCADAEGNVCGKQTVGLLQRRHVRIDGIKYIGKESNSLEEVDAGLFHSPENVYTEYVDPRRDEWETKIRPALHKVPLSVQQRETGLSRRMLINARTGQTRPHPDNQERLAMLVRELGLA